MKISTWVHLFQNWPVTQKPLIIKQNDWNSAEYLLNVILSTEWHLGQVENRGPRPLVDNIWEKTIQSTFLLQILFKHMKHTRENLYKSC